MPTFGTDSNREEEPVSRVLELWFLVAAVVLSSCSGKEQGSPPHGQAPPPGAAAQPSASVTLTPELIARNNRGVALMGQFDYQAAYDLFAKLVTEQPGWLATKVNLAIAQLNLNRPGSDDLATAERLLREVLAADSGNLRANYCLGILLLNGGEIPAASRALSACFQGRAERCLCGVLHRPLFVRAG